MLDNEKQTRYNKTIKENSPMTDMKISQYRGT